MNSSFGTIYKEPEILKSRSFLGNTLHVLRDPVDFLGSLTQNYGPVVTARFLDKKYYILQHPDHIKHVLLQNNKTYCKPGATKLLRLFLGEGLSTSNGELWLRQRRIMQPAFHRERLQLILDIINEETTVFISRLKLHSGISPINITHEFLQLTISIISRAMFSTALKEDMQKMIDALEALAEFASKWMKSFIKFPTGWPTSANRRFKSNCKIFDDIIYGMIEGRRKEMKHTGYSPHGDLLDMLMSYYDEESKCGMTEKQLRDEVTTMFMAGHETTAQTLSWIVYHLAKEKDIYRSVKQEGSNMVSPTLPAFDDLAQLIYTRQVIMEALRCYPPIWALVRRPLKADTIHGIKVPPQSNVLINIYGMHHHPGFWSTPHNFNPEHFNAGEAEQRPQFAYLPFGGGPRLCLGNNFATMVMQVVVSRLCNHFEFEIPDGYVPIVEPNISLRAKGGIQVLLKTIA